MEYKDLVESQLYELAEAKGAVFLSKWKFSFGKSDVVNKNGRYYPKKIFTSAVEALNTRIQKSPVPGMTDHPIGGGNTRLSDVSHVLLKTWMENGVAWAEAGILDTTRGKDTLKILKSNVPIGASLRGFGDIDREGKVKPGLDIRSVDLVSDPSFGPDATITQANVIESYVSEEEYQFNEEDLKEITSAMDELSDEVIALIQEKLAREDNIEMTAGKVKALALWIRMSKENFNIAPFHEWFEKQQQLFAQNDPNLREELNEKLRRQANIKEEKRIAGFSYGVDKARIEKRQKEIDEALAGSRHDAKTISRLFAEYVLAGGKLSRAEYIKKFGF
jgi:hypothetical protein